MATTTATATTTTPARAAATAAPAAATDDSAADVPAACSDNVANRPAACAPAWEIRLDPAMRAAIVLACLPTVGAAEDARGVRTDTGRLSRCVTRRPDGRTCDRLSGRGRSSPRRRPASDPSVSLRSRVSAIRSTLVVSSLKAEDRGRLASSTSSRALATCPACRAMGFSERASDGEVAGAAAGVSGFSFAAGVPRDAAETRGVSTGGPGWRLAAGDPSSTRTISSAVLAMWHHVTVPNFSLPGVVTSG